MSANELAELVNQMMVAQQEYFRTRSAEALASAKTLETKVRRCCRAILDERQRKLPFAYVGGDSGPAGGCQS